MFALGHAGLLVVTHLYFVLLIRAEISSAHWNAFFSEMSVQQPGKWVLVDDDDAVASGTRSLVLLVIV